MCFEDIWENCSKPIIDIFIDKFLSPFIFGYRKCFSNLTALLCVLEKWKAALNNKYFAGDILMDLSKTFDTINYELLITKLQAYALTKADWKYFEVA